MNTNEHSNVHVILFFSCVGVVFMPFVPFYLRFHSFIYLCILGQGQLTSLLRSFSSYETSQSVCVVETGESREKKRKKKPLRIFKQNLTHMCPQQTQQLDDRMKRVNEISALHYSVTGGGGGNSFIQLILITTFRETATH